MATVQIKSGGDFTTTGAWAADLDGDSLAADEIGEISGLITDTSQIAFQNITPNGFKVILKANAAASFAGNVNASTNKLQWNPDNGAAITVSSGGDGLRVYNTVGTGCFEMRGVQLKQTSNYGGPLRIDSANCVFESCIVDRSVSTFNNYAIVAWWAASGIMANNCLFMASHASGTKVCVFSDGNEIYMKNCAFVRNGTPTNSMGILMNLTMTTHIENCVFYGWEEDAHIGGTSILTGEHCATDKASANVLPATGIQTNLIGATEWESVSWSGAEDFRLKSSTSVKLKNNASQSNTLSTDIIGTVWNYAIGPWQPPGGTEFRKPVVTTFGFGL